MTIHPSDPPPDPMLVALLAGVAALAILAVWLIALTYAVPIP